MEYTLLNTGAKMPLEGFGVFQIPDAKECEQVVYDAIRTGYRLLDTAASYGNEEALGKGVKRAISEGIVTREELFITTKVWVSDMKTEDSAYEAVRTSLKKLDLSYVDLILLHQALGDYFAAYRGITRAYKEGLAKAIGVSNFYPFVLANLCANVEVIPAVNQVEFNPLFQQKALREVLATDDVKLEAWYPLGHGDKSLLENPVITALAEKYGKNAGQIILRFEVQEGFIVLPKSTNPDRIKGNIDIFDFELTSEEMESIRVLDTGKGSHDPEAPGVGEMLLNAFDVHKD